MTATSVNGQEDRAIQFEALEGERIGSFDILGVSFTVGELIMRLARLNPELPIVSGRNNGIGIVLHHHALVDLSKGYVSFTQLYPANAPE